MFCTKTHACGHGCKGFKGEEQCLPCLNKECVKIEKKTLDMTEDDLCSICYMTGLGDQPSI